MALFVFEHCKTVAAQYVWAEKSKYRQESHIVHSSLTFNPFSSTGTNSIDQRHQNLSEASFDECLTGGAEWVTSCNVIHLIRD
jgi:hypothetical protein